MENKKVKTLIKYMTSFFKMYGTYVAGGAILALYFWIIVLGNDPLQPAIASKILRFHVLANSDTIEDQNIKLEVRDAVGNYLQPYLADSKNLSQTKEIVNAHMEEVIAIAQETMADYGYDYVVTAQITQTEFPEKTYGEYTFPKGKYEALQIQIGEAKGQNWWCVLYPNMCFKGSVYEVVEEEAKQELKEVLSPFEYADVFVSGKVKLRLKCLEYFKN